MTTRPWEKGSPLAPPNPVWYVPEVSVVGVVFALLSLPMPATTADDDAPMKLVTAQGLELTAHEQVFVLFAALNAAGYSEEPKRRGPPLHAPVFHPIRERVRRALQTMRGHPAMKKLRGVFQNEPRTIEVYLEAALSMAPGASEPKGPAISLARRLEPLADFRRDPELVGLLEELSEAQREHMLILKTALEKDFEAVRRVLGDPGFRAPLSLVVVPNPLDGHGLIRRLTLDETVYVVVGPGLEASCAAVLAAAVEPAVSAVVTRAYRRATNLSRSWSTLRTSKRITERWPNGPAYLTDAVTQALAHRARTRKGGPRSRDADEAFVDAQAKSGMRWARAALRIVDGSGARPLAQALPGLVAEATP